MTRLPARLPDKYCHNGGIAFAHHSRRRLAWGPRWRSWPLPAVPQKWLVCRDKARRGPGSVPFGGSDGLVCLFFDTRGQVLPERGTASTLRISGVRLRFRRRRSSTTCSGCRRRRPHALEHLGVYAAGGTLESRSRMRLSAPSTSGGTASRSRRTPASPSASPIA
jgi:hypothetical protein